ncbi:family 20 glycosylhydrolase [Flavihumibacter solisilvae]|uniref:beta-N-acetylhexosaminidase n=1 Tax=Flavihumibacter solisilvae TaxID=1349421 RepID=A0A0C1IQC8_9BACT|nr:family 20 glycosylhydrolase [Flavihumibacter solisilvae]KIC92674.1 beta-N-acetylhexosaminidase [Flavihumibacter solisilvae]
MRVLLVAIQMLVFKMVTLAQQPVHIIPQPVSLAVKEGSFLLDKHVSLKLNTNDKQVHDVARYFSNYIKQLSGTTLQMAKAPVNGRYVAFVLDPAITGSEEGYRVAVTRDAITITAKRTQGLFYGVQSILQTLPAIRTNQVLQVPCMEIVDTPRFKWRGMMLDVSRHFFAPELVKEFIDLLATYKMNVFHWHLVDGAGWRLEIKKYPRLTDLAAWRVDDWGKPWNWADVEFNADRSKATYGGYYTQEQVREIVAYAKARHITIVPEIEMPGHSEAALAAYPEFSCTPKSHFGQTGNFYARTVQSNYCAGNDSAFVFLQNILSEVINLFPSTYIHVGGDEVDKTSWKECAKCQSRKKAEGLKDEEELQSYFIRRMEKYLASKGRKLLGWDEILEGGLAPQATVMSWRGEAGGIKAAQMNHDVVMSPGSPCYFDHYQGDPETEPPAIGGFNTLKKVYSYEPIPAELGAEHAKHVLGAQANLWTEYVTTYEHVEYMVLPRMLALSEVLWSPKEARDWKQFQQRLRQHMVGFEQRGLHYSKGNFKVDILPLVIDGKLFVKLEAEHEDAVIYYTIDGTDPNTGSLRYEKPFEVNRSMNLKAGLALDNSMVKAKPAEQSFTFNKATGHAVQYATPNSRYYQANGTNTLTDGLRGTKNIGKQWHAFSGNDMVATIDLGREITAGTMSLGCLQNYDQWIFYPKWVKFEASVDGNNFSEITTVANSVPISDRAPQFQDFSARFDQRKFRYVRVTAANAGLCPKGHPGEGQAGWLFVDELVVE